MSSTAQAITAAILVIGDEILSGRTKDKNIGYIAEYLTNIGIDLKQVRVVPDDEADIVDALNALRNRFTYVFTTGGIGPTHDDITADCVAKAFGVPIDHDPRAVAMLQTRYQPGELNEARLRMARIPAGADLIDNPISKAPGFRIGNVIVMAGVPRSCRSCWTMSPRPGDRSEDALGIDRCAWLAGRHLRGSHRGSGAGACRRQHRLLSFLHQRRLPQPDRRALEGCGSTRRGGRCDPCGHRSPQFR